MSGWTSEQQATVQAAIDKLPTISTVGELRDLPEDCYLIANDQVWRRKDYLFAQGLVGATDEKLFSDIAKVLVISDEEQTP